MNKKITAWILLFCFTLAHAYAEGTPKELEEVLTGLQEKMSKVDSISTAFIQEKNLAMFKQKVILKGNIYIQKPAMLAWKVSSPLRYALVISGTDISQWDQDSGRVQSLSLNRNPSFQVAVQQMQNWFSGSYKSMEADYDIKLISQQPIELEFIPKEKAVSANFIQQVNVLFSPDEHYIKQINILEKTGDSTLLEFINPELNREIPTSAWEVKA
jgi:outer membrane lipoprotein-sorting protein